MSSRSRVTSPSNFSFASLYCAISLRVEESTSEAEDLGVGVDDRVDDRAPSVADSVPSETTMTCDFCGIDTRSFFFSIVSGSPEPRIIGRAATFGFFSARAMTSELVRELELGLHERAQVAAHVDGGQHVVVRRLDLEDRRRLVRRLGVLLHPRHQPRREDRPDQQDCHQCRRIDRSSAFDGERPGGAPPRGPGTRPTTARPPCLRQFPPTTGRAASSCRGGGPGSRPSGAFLG